MSDVREERKVTEDQSSKVTEDQAKLLFEFCKHLSTLDVATALAILAIYREAAVESYVVWIALVLFGASLVLCVILMFWIAGGTRHRLFVGFGSYFAGALYVLGVGAFGLFATGFQEYLKHPIVAGIVLIISVINFFWIRKRAQRPPPTERDSIQ
jgi:hypothetical protein